MQEMDSCPICGTICTLEHGLATCETCKTKWRRRDDPSISGRRIYEKWTCKIPELIFSIPYIVSSAKFGPKLCGWKTVATKQVATDILEKKTEKTPMEKRKTFEETIAVSSREPALYDFRLMRGDKVEGKISSDKPVDIFFFDQKNLERFMRDWSFEPEDSSIGIYDMKVEFQARKQGLLTVVIDNLRREPARVTVNLHSVLRKS